MDKKISILNLDNSFQFQNFYKDFDYEVLDLFNTPGTNSFCTKESLLYLNEQLKSRTHNFLTFIGSGNYHYISYIITKNIGKPFSLVLFDNHTDMLESSFFDLLSCGSWVYNLLKDNPFLVNIIIIGVNNRYENLIPVKYANRINILNHTDVSSYDNHHKVFDNITTEDVYISIDKDVLSTNFSITNWDQGIMDLSVLTDDLNYILHNRRVIGIDVCGEYTYNPSREKDILIDTAININNSTNKKILNTVFKNI